MLESDIPADTIQCRCGNVAKRRYQVAVNKSSLKPSGRWDPVVGAYVRNDAEFRSLLAMGRDQQAEKLQKDVDLVPVDSRDMEGIDELHGVPSEVRQADLEFAAKAKRDGTPY